MMIESQADFLKMQGIGSVLSNTPDDFKIRYAMVFQFVLHKSEEICGESVRKEFNKRFPGLEPHHFNCWSALFRANKNRAIEGKQLEEAHRYDKSIRPSSHAATKPIYRSLVKA